MNIKDEKDVYFPRQFINKFNEDNINKKKEGKKTSNKNELLINSSDTNIIKKDKIIYINIDSQARNKNPKNIIEDEYNFLESNPISVKKDSNIISVVQENTYLPEDKIVVINVDTTEEIYNDCLTFVNNSNYIIVHHPNHGIGEDCKKYNDEFNIRLKIYDDITLINNIPTNLIKGIHDINLYNSNFEFIQLNNYYINEDPVKNYIEEYINDNDISIKTFNENNYLIKLPIKFISDNENSSYTYPDNIGIKFMNIGGIPLNEINANYPLSPIRKHGNQTVNEANQYQMTFNVDVKAYKDVSNAGGNKVIISKIVGYINGYLNSSNYVIRAKTPLYNIKKIELVSMEFPFLDTIINSNNNKLYWKRIDNGDIVNQISLNVGNYDADSLALEIANKIEKSTEIYQGETIISYDTMSVLIDIAENKTTFEAYNVNLNFSKYYFKKEEINGVEYIMLYFYNSYIHYLNIGDKIKIDEYVDEIGIPENLVNTNHLIYNIIESYLYIKLELFADIDSIELKEEYLPIKIWVPIYFQLNFNYSDTFGKIIGFNDVGQSYAVTKFATTISNKDNYNETDFSIDKETIINFSGFNNYCYLYLNNYNNIITNTTQTSIFYKLQLSGNPGDILFNPYVDTPLIFDVLENQITEFDIKFLDKNGNLLNFSNTDHSFTLKITEEISNPVKTLKLNKTENLKKLENEII